jgi:TonB family protein
MPASRSLIEKGTLFGALIGLHFLLYLAFESASYHAAPSVESPAALVTVFIRPRIREPGEPLSVVDPASLRLRLDVLLSGLHSAEPAFDFSVERNAAAAVVAPTLKGDGHSGMQPFLQQSGLRPGEGATVVLRVEVLESGDPGRILVDASSGNRQIDQAAVEFARTQHWYAGRVNGRPRPVWIRWGVRLQA